MQENYMNYWKLYGKTVPKHARKLYEALKVYIYILKTTQNSVPSGKTVPKHARKLYEALKVYIYILKSTKVLTYAFQ